ncbi:hypothetical protein KDA_59220 [Dictyobacter alpinus]|uniref:Uncharacterized protein n=1 Tax=Dictyobacter alpinus TaxID=2014873 RepID=A0A402BG99_9CHLR|nr:VC0807 family protein [Dictyobacter alpinus]GCE30438.1 hypothetical protein KDA_59220 [Dictyobacter alpinus]
MESTTNLMQAQTNNHKKIIIRGIIISIVINGLCPWLIYNGLINYLHVAQMPALLATGIPSIIDSVVGIIKNRRIDFMAGIAFLSIITSLLAISLGGSPKLYLVRGSLLGMISSVIILVSFFFPKPATYYTLRYVTTGNSAALIEKYEQKWQQDNIWRRMLRMQALLWGTGLLSEGIVRTYLAFTLDVSRFLAVSPFVFYGFYAVLMVLSTIGGTLFSYIETKRKATTDHSKPEH